MLDKLKVGEQTFLHLFKFYNLKIKKMKNALLLVMLMFLSAFTNAQNSFHKKTIKFLPQSQLNITGDTNISAFECIFNTSYLKKEQVIQYTGTNSYLRFTDAVLTLDTKAFDCGNKRINKDFHDLIKSDEHPEIFLELYEIKIRSNNFAIAKACITIAGKQKTYELPVEIIEGNVSHFKGKLKLNINDFGLEPPKKLFGMIVVKDDIEINFNLVVQK